MKRSLTFPLTLFFTFSLLSIVLLFPFFSSISLSVSNCNPNPNSSPISTDNPRSTQPHLNVFVADLPRSYNYGLLDLLWSLPSVDSRLPNSNPTPKPNPNPNTNRTPYPPYPDNPLIKQYSAEYWLLGDLETPPDLRSNESVATRVYDLEQADVTFVPFFATLSAEMELGWGKKGNFMKKDGEINGDYKRQREVVDIIKRSEAWNRSGGRDHVFVLTDPVAMWHVREEIAAAILLVVDFGGWYKLDSKSTDVANTINNSSQTMIRHTQVSMIKDVIVPYTHLLPTLHPSENGERKTLLYFKGAKHRHRGGLIREKLWDILINEPDVVIQEGFPSLAGRQQSIMGMRSSEFCLHPAGDTPTSCRLFDALASLCIPVVVSDQIELPFEGIIDYSKFVVFVSDGNAMQPKWLVSHLRNFTKEEKERFRFEIARVQHLFEYENGYSGGIGPVLVDGAVNHIWQMIRGKVPMLKLIKARERRKPKGTSIPQRCNCI